MSALDGPLTPAPGGTAIDLPVAGLELPAAGVFARRDREALLGLLGLVLVVIPGLVICLAAERTNALLPESLHPVSASGLAGPLAHLGLYLHSGELLAVLATMFAGYVLAVRQSAHISLRTVWVAVGTFVAFALIAPPLFSTDVFSYQAYGREFFGLHVNPYVTSPQVLLLEHTFYPLIGSKWVNTPTVYGPIFTLLSGLFSDTSTTTSIAFGVYAFKTIAALSCLGIVALVARAARGRGMNPVPAIALIGLNPLVVLYGVGGGHNDLLMMVLAAAGIAALVQRRSASSGGLVIASAAIKLTAGVFLPFALAARLEPDGSRMTRQVARGAAMAVTLCIGVGLLAFGPGLGHSLTTLRQVQNESGWQSVPGFLSSALHWHAAAHDISLLFGVAFVGTLGWLTRRVWRNELDWLEGAGWASFFLLVASSSILPWYVTWMLVPVALTRDGRLWRAAFWFSGWVMVTTMIAYLPHPPVILGVQT